MAKIKIECYQPDNGVGYALYYVLIKDFNGWSRAIDFCAHGDKITQYRVIGWLYGRKTKAFFGSWNAIFKQQYKTLQHEKD